MARICERCKKGHTTAKNSRFCWNCRALVLAELKEAGYLTAVPRREPARNAEQRELTYETKFGTIHG